MSRQKNISVKSYYQRAKVFGYLAIIIAVSLAVIYLYDQFAK
jgi:hypothetical protein